MSRPALDQVSVVIVSWNVRDQLQKALELLAPSPELEVIVVDNASGDGSAQMVAKQFPGVQLVCNESNTLYAPAVNQGADLCQRPWLLLLNPDCELTSETLKGLVEYLGDMRTMGRWRPC